VVDRPIFNKGVECAIKCVLANLNGRKRIAYIPDEELVILSQVCQAIFECDPTYIGSKPSALPK
jgi:hypothetical protein